MFTHYFTTALRHFRRHQLTTGINVICLALGLACFIAAYAFVTYLRMSDTQFANSSRTYALTTTLKAGSFSIHSVPFAADHVAKYLKTDFPQIEMLARIRALGQTLVSTGERQADLLLMDADPDFLRIFDLPLIAGDAKNALRSPHEVILAKTAALQLFGSYDVIGRHLTLRNKIDVTVAGVLGEIPAPSHMDQSSLSNARFDILGSRDILNESPPTSAMASEQWLNTGSFCGCRTYMVLHQGGSNSRALADGLMRFVQRRVPADQLEGTHLEFGIVPMSKLSEISLNALLSAGAGNPVSAAFLILTLGGLVLLIACLNYANLATAEAMLQGREIGIRKVLGATKYQVISQSAVEAGILAAVALACLSLVTALMLPVLKARTGIDLGGMVFSRPTLWLFVFALLPLVAVGAGGLPALILSGLRPTNALRTDPSRSGPRFLSTVLTGIQFAAASALLVLMIVMYQQGTELRRALLAQMKTPLVVITNDLSKANVRFDVLRNALLAHSEIEDVTSVSMLPWKSGDESAFALSRSPSQGVARQSSFSTVVSDNFFKVVGARLLAGRGFDSKRADDAFTMPGSGNANPKPVSVVVDETLAKQLGFTSPQAAVGALIYAPMSGGPPLELQIIGVADNKPLKVIGVGLTSSAYFFRPASRYAIARIRSNEVNGAVRAIDTVWKQLSPNAHLQRRFMDELFDEGYGLFTAMNLICDVLVGFALAIASMGLLGTAIFVVNRRLREVGVRKTLGASSSQILMLLLENFSRPVVAANILSWPLAYFGANAYLGMFTHRSELTLLPFLVSLVIVLGVAWIAVSMQAINAARMSPARVLRYE